VAREEGEEERKADPSTALGMTKTTGQALTFVREEISEGNVKGEKRARARGGGAERTATVGGPYTGESGVATEKHGFEDQPLHEKSAQPGMTVPLRRWKSDFERGQNSLHY
jgi:hypothetical protein